MDAGDVGGDAAGGGVSPPPPFAAAAVGRQQHRCCFLHATYAACSAYTAHTIMGSTMSSDITICSVVSSTAVCAESGAKNVVNMMANMVNTKNANPSIQLNQRLVYGCTIACTNNEITCNDANRQNLTKVDLLRSMAINPTRRAISTKRAHQISSLYTSNNGPVTQSYTPPSDKATGGTWVNTNPRHQIEDYAISSGCNIDKSMRSLVPQ